MLNLMTYSFVLRNMNDDENSAVVCVLMVLSKPATNARNLDKFGICNRGSGAERGRTAIKLHFPEEHLLYTEANEICSIYVRTQKRRASSD